MDDNVVRCHTLYQCPLAAWLNRVLLQVESLQAAMRMVSEQHASDLAWNVLGTTTLDQHEKAYPISGLVINQCSK